MCGIYGFIATPDTKTTGKEFLFLLEKLCLLSETRGKDAAGLVCLDTQRITVLKRPLRARKLLRSNEYASFKSRFLTAYEQNKPFLAMGHTRMVTNGKAESHNNNQPVIRNELVCIHNGIVVNDQRLWNQNPSLIRNHEVDTEVILALVEYFLGQGQSLAQAVCSMYDLIQGANSVALVSTRHNLLALATANGSLFTAMSKDNRLAVFASEKYILDQILLNPVLKQFFSGVTATQLPPGHALFLEFGTDSLQPHRHGLHAASPVQFTSLIMPHARAVHDLRPAVKSRPAVPVHFNYAALERLCTVDHDRVRALRRCTRCLLPETFPFITFDANGVCSYCQNYKPWEGPGKAALEELVHPYRRPKGEPDCLVPVSGGRDSSYALHYICKELGLKPVAYTYDWGMVTDLARRNISRMCGALGVEHILISADIAQKRDYIRRNVLAWLKKPHLGTVTLFMAGDKHFFYYARMLQKQMNLGGTLFGMNPFERTDFKVAFCGINENFQKDKHYNLKIVNKLRMMVFFGLRFLENPAYLNRTLWDSFAGFFSYYLIPKDYHSIYDYIYWDEDIVTKTILDQYDWETSPDTQSTWRIGDGTASFYNYIYYRVAGFSENDTLRSNQIREGKLDRDDALEIIYQDNMPRIESIKWYCDTIQIDPFCAIKKINQVNKFY
jgi:predicted glutamine amidotransferase